MTTPDGVKDRIKKILREDDVPFFSDEDIDFYLKENGGNFSDAVYHMLIVKSEDTTIQLTGYTTADTSKYYLRLAQRYRPQNSGILN